MINSEGIEFNRDLIVNSELVTRDICGNIKFVKILKKTFEVVRFKDEKYFEYVLPSHCILGIVDGITIDTCLGDIYESHALEVPIKIKDYLNRDIKIYLFELKIKEIGWPEVDFPFIEGNLIVRTSPYT